MRLMKPTTKARLALLATIALLSMAVNPALAECDFNENCFYP